MDFTLDTLERLLTSLHDAGHLFIPVKEFFENRAPRPGKLIILRHDVDKKPANSLAVARFESELGIRGTYYFRIIPESFNKDIVCEIASMGHEIGYHYEDLCLAGRKSKGERRKPGINGVEELAVVAIESFRENLEEFRKVVPITTICMHGSPMSRHDSRLIWKYYDYRELGIIAEPYFDFSLEDMLYLTDTGRRWDGSSSSIRDKVVARDPGFYSGWKRKPVTGSAMSMTERAKNFQKNFRFRKTEDILAAGRAHILPGKMLMTLHPQRWSDNYGEWLKELLAQNVKNQVKYFINRHKSE